MIAVYIILGILLLIGLALIIPIKIHIIVDEDFCVKLKYIFLNFKLYPKEKDEKKEKAKTDDAKEKKPSAIKEFTKNLISEKGIIDAIREIVSIIKELLAPFGPFFAKMSVDIKDLTVVVASTDAARTATYYGAICAAVYDILAVVDKKFKLRRKNVKVFSDFLSEKASIKANVIFGVKPIRLFPLIKSLVKTYMNRILKPQNSIKKGDVKNG